MTKITFLEVEATDVGRIREDFPDATIVEDVLLTDKLIEECRDAEIICCFLYSKFTNEVLAKLPKLKLIVTRTAGYDHIDLKTCAERGITVCNVPDYGAHVIAEHTFALLLSAVRHVVEGEQETEKLHFDWHGLRGMALRGKTLGLIGTGHIGAQVARIASMGFLMRVLATDPYPNQAAALENHFTYVSKEQVLAESDVISLHCPLLKSTKHIVDADAIKQMKDGVVILNTARGGLVDTNALLNGLKSKKISTVALDVLECEQDINCNREIMTIENALITPHIAFYADDSVKRMYDEAIATIKRWQGGDKLVHQINS